MKWGESSFDIAYLVIAVVLGIMMISKSKNKLGKMMGITTLVLGCGDAFHLVPRVLNYFVDYDFTMYLGVGKLVTSITIRNPNMTSYEEMFLNAVPTTGSKITVNYTSETSDLVDLMIATKSELSNVVKGTLVS